MPFLTRFFISAACRVSSRKLTNFSLTRLNNKRRLLFFFLFLIAGTSWAATPPVPEGKVAVFIGQDNATINRYVEATGHEPAGFMIYVSIQEMQGLDTWSKDYGAGRCHAEQLLEKYPGRAIQIGLYMVDALKPTYQGVYDDNIAHLAQWLKAVKVPVFLRIGYEFDGPHNHYDPEEYKRAYRYIVDQLKEAGVSNVDYVWHSFANASVKELAPWYPGGDYVDWVGLSYFDQPQDFMLHVVDFAKARNKPLMIAEATPKNRRLKSSLAWKIWYQPFFRFVDMYDVKAISYINSHWESMPMWQGKQWGDARVQEYPEIKKQWLKKMQEPRYQFQFDF